ncbi:hypothetical protein SAMN05192583_2640 [Sphingomonas gellani]|uniref:4-amino-4-deoxy-L-arabinose transferase n=1 Tax=Sphingomonas gellani TaxID=1166340 RepID=A0A1H8FZY0_9SPHN|nr:DUF6311 domain-containing protein [Sphingomonas gellani]SEN37286.1 hypothetical protein SAMN05192583_2640 [Sphingomonas gellani]
MHRLPVLLALFALTLVLFCWWLHPQVLDINRAGWTLNGKDWGQNALGLAAYLRRGGWPGTATPLILAPDGIHLLLMDSNPLLGLVLKPFAGWLIPAGVQFIGWMMFADVALQVMFAWILVRDHAPTRAHVLGGTALLCLLPSFFNRFPHPNLAAHWLILCGLWLFTDRVRARRWWAWLALIGVAGMTHSYLLLIVLAIWGSAVLREVALGPDRRGAMASVLGASGLGVLLVLLHGLNGEAPVSTGTYGSFPMALDALWNPTGPGYSAFLPGTMLNANQGFEGFQYLGVGLLLLVGIAILSAIGRRPRVDGMVWLLPAFAVLTMVAVSDVVVFGSHRLLHARPPQWVIDGLDLVRASGRLFWPVAYAMIYAALLAVWRMPRRDVIVAAALILQVADMVPMMATIRAETSAATSTRTFRRTRDPRWSAMIAQAGAIDVQPPDPFRDGQLLEEVGWRAMLACRPMRFMYVSRVPRAAEQRLAGERRAFLRGEVPGDRLVLLYRGEPVPAGLRARAMTLDGVTVIRPVMPARPAACRS